MRVLAHSVLSAVLEAICTRRNAEPGTSLVAMASEALDLALPGRPKE